MIMRKMRLIMCIAAAAALIAGCAPVQSTNQNIRVAAPKVICAKEVVVLMPDDGDTHKVGAIEVSTRGGSQIVDRAEFAVTMTEADKPPTEPKKMDYDQIRKLFGEAIDIRPILPKSYLLYFDTNSTVLTAISAALIPTIINDIKSRTTVDISIIGHTDTVASAEYNLRLSMERADKVYQTLVSSGLTAGQAKGTVVISSYGKEDLLVKTPDNTPEPQNRRVEVIVR
ncbi:MAG: OmpA family protein [Nitrospirae bacterium]|nr:OmpA family protein [Nitrospirota bacterium]